MRYDTFFTKLLKKLCYLFPEVQIIVAVNGFHDSEKHESYLNRIRKDWNLVNNVKFILHQLPNGLSQLWNEIIQLSTTDHVLILNDDIGIVNYIRYWFETLPWGKKDFCKVNGSWSHFIINRDCFESVGPFDQGFKGIGFEDIDYEARLTLSGAKINNLNCQYISNLTNMPEETSFEKISDKLWGKYTLSNFEYFLTKWELVDEGDNKNVIMYVKELEKNIRLKQPGQLLFQYSPTIKIQKLGNKSPFIEVCT